MARRQAQRVARDRDLGGAADAGDAADRDRGAVAADRFDGERVTRFAGYAAIFDRADRGGDIVRKGAFLRALEQAGEVPLLWQHKAGSVIGRIDHLSEDERALRVIAALRESSAGQRAARVVESG